MRSGLHQEGGHLSKDRNKGREMSQVDISKQSIPDRGKRKGHDQGGKPAWWESDAGGVGSHSVNSKEATGATAELGATRIPGLMICRGGMVRKGWRMGHIESFKWL